MQWSIKLFGNLSVHWAHTTVTHFRTRKTAALLSYLAYYGSRRHQRDELAGLFWPEDTAEAAHNSLRVAISTLRHLIDDSQLSIPPLLISDRLTVQLNCEACSTDVAGFEAAIRSAKQAEDPSAHHPLLLAAVEHYSGSLLPSCEESWVEGERQKLAELYFWAMGKLIRHATQSHDYNSAVDFARSAVAADPLREESHRYLIRLYHAMGRSSAAIRQYQQLEYLLRETLGISPSTATRALAAQVKQEQRPVDPVNRSTAVSSVPTASVPPNTPDTARFRNAGPARARALPPAYTRLFGREEELRLLQSQLAPDSCARSAAPASHPTVARLVTLTGFGGCGKTRLALEIATRLQPFFPDSVWWVDYADQVDGARMVEVIGEALGIDGGAEGITMTQLADVLTHRPGLIVLDNVEHLIEEGAPIIQELRARVPALTLLVTSRQPLGLIGEKLFPVLPLPTPIGAVSPERLSEFASIQLFIDRAQAVQPEFAVQAENAADLAVLCRLLDGIPLAIELAAPWVRTLTPAEIRSQLSNRFELLVSQYRDVPVRHRALHQVIESSYRLLSDRMQRFLLPLAEFKGGWTAEAAAAVCEQPAAMAFLAELHAQSLIVAEHPPVHSGATRFRFLETVRAFVIEQRSDVQRALYAQRHADFFLKLAEEAQPHIPGPDMQEWLDRLEIEHDNLRAALAWYHGCQDQNEAALRLAAALSWFWMVRGHMPEGRLHLQKVLDRQHNAAPSMALGRALSNAANIAKRQGDFMVAHEYYERCLSVSRALKDGQRVAAVLNSMGDLASRQGHHAEAQALFEECLIITRETPEGPFPPLLLNLGMTAQEQQNVTLARSYYEESRVISAKKGDQRHVAASYCCLGSLAEQEGKPSEALALYYESLSILKELGDKDGIIHVTGSYADLLIMQHSYDAARTLYSESLALSHQTGNRTGVARDLEGLARIALQQGDRSRAGTLFGAAENLREAIGAPLPPHHRATYDRLVDEARNMDDDQAFALAWSRGRVVSLEKLIAATLDAML